MKVRVRLFARARDLAGRDSVMLEVPAGATAGGVRRRLAEACPGLAGILGRCALAVDNDFVEDAATVADGAEVAVLPPVSGG